MGQLFGTDGIRGVANRFPMTCEMALNVGRAVVMHFANGGKRPKIIIGKDTRLSGAMLEHAMAAGICSAGGEACLAGVLPTPGVAYLTVAENADAGVMISASHNPYYDNGIKIFGCDAFKLPDTAEIDIEALLTPPERLRERCEKIQAPGGDHTMRDAEDRYRRFLSSAFPGDLSLKGMKIILDCANGATFRAAPLLFRELGADVEALFVQPDGRNINDRCGSQHPEHLAGRVVASGADIGLAFDGDGDRLIAVDEQGRVVTGDQMLAVLGGYLKQQGLLTNNIVVSTVMSNIGLGMAFKEMGIDHRKTDVGDRYVVQEMRRLGAMLGGEDSGHMIFLDHHTTGDGIMTALRLIEVMKVSGTPLSLLTQVMKVYPQVLMNVEVTAKPPIATIPEIADAVAEVESKLGEQGRVLVRYSGTQSLCRVMIEGPIKEEIEHYCHRIIDVVRSELGRRPGM